MEEIKKMRPREYIKIRGANEHNLKNIDLDIPRNEMVVLTGMSGSGKSSLAFDTIYAEGQRRYMESLSSYARMFLGQMEKPNVERIEGLSPAGGAFRMRHVAVRPSGGERLGGVAACKAENTNSTEIGGDLFWKRSRRCAPESTSRSEAPMSIT